MVPVCTLFAHVNIHTGLKMSETTAGKCCESLLDGINVWSRLLEEKFTISDC